MSFNGLNAFNRPIHLLGQRLVYLPLVEEPFLRLKLPGVNHSDLLPIRPIYSEDAHAANRHTQVEKPGLNRKPRRVRQQPNREGIFERFFDFLQRQRTIEIEGRIIPIKLHRGSIVYRSPMQCRYIVFTRMGKACQRKMTNLKESCPILYQRKPLIAVGSAR